MGNNLECGGLQSGVKPPHSEKNHPMTDLLLTQKLAALETEPWPLVDLRQVIDLSTSPAHRRGSFPAPEYTPPFQILDRQILGKLIGVELDQTEGIFSEVKDVSSNRAGVCLVTSSVFGRWNAHAGSHADQPIHWLKDPPLAQFDDRQYRGPATVLNLTSFLAGQSPPAITLDILTQAMTQARIDPLTVRRLVVRTYHHTPVEWDDTFAYLTPEAGQYLGQLPGLLLFGTDAPSVDHPAASPIHACAHGGLWAGRVAILEGLESNFLPLDLRLDGVLHILWNPMQLHADAKGALVTFYPSH